MPSGRCWNRCFVRKRRDDGSRPAVAGYAIGCRNGVFWSLRTGAPWHDLPRRYPPLIRPVIAASNSGSARDCSPSCCRNWPKDLRDRGKLDLSRPRSSTPKSFSSAKKGALAVGLYSPRQRRKQNHGDQRRPWSSSLPCTWPALRRMKQNSVEGTVFEQRFLAGNTPAPDRPATPAPTTAIRLDAQIRERFGVQLVAPHNSSRRRKATQDGRRAAAATGVAGRSSVCSPGFA